MLTSSGDALSYLTQAKKLQESGIGAEHANGVEFGLKDGGDTSEPLSLADRLRLNSGVADTMKNIQKLPAMAGGRVQKKGFFCV